MNQNISIIVAFGAGFISFFSPCVLPLLPAYLSFITGLSLDDLREKNVNRRLVIARVLAFILGFTIVFVLLGASVTFFRNIVVQNREFIKILAGIIIIIFGIHLTGLLKIKFLNYEKKLHLTNIHAGLIGSFIVGVAFSIGWSPCIGPILGSILTMAATEANVGRGIILLSVYSLGLAIPFLLTAIFVDTLLKRFSRLTKYIKPVSIAGGILLICVGVYLIANGFVV